MGYILLPCYAFWIKNVGATYMRAMTTIFHDMWMMLSLNLREIEVYVDDVIIKSKK